MPDIVFEIPGEPKSKARHRTTRQGVTYTPKTTVEYENWVKVCYGMACTNKMLYGPIKAVIRAYFAIPKSTSKKKRVDMQAGIIRPTKKPDADNLAKIVLDSINNVAFDDDKQVVELIVHKYYCSRPRVEVELKQLEPEEEDCHEEPVR